MRQELTVVANGEFYAFPLEYIEVFEKMRQHGRLYLDHLGKGEDAMIDRDRSLPLLDTIAQKWGLFEDN